MHYKVAQIASVANQVKPLGGVHASNKEKA
jgi:hypothetical protein